ncbi:hypothetical protein HRG_001725 [Hirsutella rhossiliensis]|uniref:Uncharacterized protein n=1 Tax=Hirsutella rhossiliensis TaxID=111463 RepID=A0A9P8SKW3_9HYPO|nr:uncharacterized protein HRG_01725 [Hirsutella rhossiliensis]KAH0966316.1 hypothetical protein HRG_01725 [Hirsutella rhossiliensis]
MDASNFTLQAQNFVPIPLDPLFLSGESRAWHLRCCRDDFEDDAEVWLKSLQETEGRILFGDKRLPYDLWDDVRAAIGREDEARFPLFCGKTGPAFLARKRRKRLLETATDPGWMAMTAKLPAAVRRRAMFYRREQGDQGPHEVVTKEPCGPGCTFSGKNEERFVDTRSIRILTKKTREPLEKWLEDIQAYVANDGDIFGG